MAVLSIYTENSNENALTQILALNETHFIFDKDVTYINLEFLTYLLDDSATIDILIHGKVLKKEEGEKKYFLRNLSDYKKYIFPFIDDEKYSEKISGDIHNYQKTFFIENLPTNKTYEPPQPKLRIKNDHTIALYLIDVIIEKEIALELINLESNEISKIQLKKNGNTFFKKETVYGFRIGFWLSTFCNSKIEGSFNYDIHFFSLEKKGEFYEKVKNKNSLNSCFFSRLWGKIDPVDGLNPIIEEIKKQKNLSEEKKTKNNDLVALHNKLLKSHSDIFIILPITWKVEGNFSYENITQPNYILYSNDDIGRLNFNQYHKYLSDQMLPALYTNTIPNSNDYAKITKFKINIFEKIVHKIIRHIIIFLVFPLFYWNIFTFLKKFLKQFILVEIPISLKHFFSYENVVIQGFIIYGVMLFLDLIIFHKSVFINFKNGVKNNIIFRRPILKKIAITVYFVLVITATIIINLPICQINSYNFIPLGIILIYLTIDFYKIK